MNNQLVYYDCGTNSWHWPIAHGEVPEPRKEPSGFAHISTEKDPRPLAFIFGGATERQWGGLSRQTLLNDLFYLDLDCMRWEFVPRLSQWPESRIHQSLIKISSTRAVLYGGTLGQFGSGTNSE